MDLEAVRTFVVAADAGQFQEAADTLAISQQAVSKRIATLERDLAVRLFTRTARGATLTIDGRAFLPHARELLRVADRADASVRPGRRALRVDVTNRRVAAAVLLQDFYRAHPGTDLDVLTLDIDVDRAIIAVEAGTIDATFHAVPARDLPTTIGCAPVIDEPHHLLVGPRHPLADAPAVTPAELVGVRIWMPGMTPHTEWAAYYAELATAFDLTIDFLGPVFGNEALLAEIAGSAELTTLVGANNRYLWPDSYDLRRIPVRDPSPIYPISLLWRADNPHPVLAALRTYLASRRTARPDAGIWLPSWAVTTNLPVVCRRAKSTQAWTPSSSV